MKAPEPTSHPTKTTLPSLLDVPVVAPPTPVKTAPARPRVIEPPQPAARGGILGLGALALFLTLILTLSARNAAVGHGASGALGAQWAALLAALSGAVACMMARHRGRGRMAWLLVAASLGALALRHAWSMALLLKKSSAGSAAPILNALLVLQGALLLAGVVWLCAPTSRERARRGFEALLLGGVLAAASAWLIAEPALRAAKVTLAGLSGTPFLASALNFAVLALALQMVLSLLPQRDSQARGALGGWSLLGLSAALFVLRHALLFWPILKPALWMDALTRVWAPMLVGIVALSGSLQWQRAKSDQRASNAWLEQLWPIAALGATALLGAWHFAVKHGTPNGVLAGETWWVAALALLALARYALVAREEAGRQHQYEAMSAQNATLQGEVEARSQQLVALQTVTADLNNIHTPTHVLSTGLSRTLDVANARVGAIWLRPGFDTLSDEGKSANGAASTNIASLERELERAEAEKRALDSIGQRPRVIAEKSVADQKPKGGRLWRLAVAQGNERPESRAALEAMHAALEGEGVAACARLNGAPPSGFGSIHLAPLQWSGQPVGAMAIVRDAEFSPAERALFDSLAFEIAAALQNSHLYQEANRLADRDAITDLLNHRATQVQFHAVLSRCKRVGSEMSVVVMDLNNFKFFNDTYGHAVGDRVLRTVAACLREACRQGDVLGRYGGDEFIALLPETDAPGTIEVCTRIAQRLESEGYSGGDGRKIPISLSFGAAVFPDDGEAALDLLALAEANLEESKHGAPTQNAGGARIVIRRAPDEAARELKKLKEASTGGSFGVLDALVTAIDNKDRYTRRHSEDVAQWATLMARQLDFPIEVQRAVRICGLLHDVGKIAVPDAILRKPGRLNDDEFNIMQSHPVFGALIVKDVPNLQDVLGGVRHHHERYDGKGYPDKLKGEDIPILGRILAVPDCFSAMTTDRPYRKSLGWEEALREIEKGKGTQFDPVMAEAFIAVAARIAAGEEFAPQDDLTDAPADAPQLDTPLVSPSVGNYVEQEVRGLALAEGLAPHDGSGKSEISLPRSVADAA